MSVDLVLLRGVSYQGQEITGHRMRGLLALLAGDLRTGCGTARLVDGLWPEEPPGNPTKALQVLVSRTRAQLGSGVIASTPKGYRLLLAEDRVDSSAVLLRAAASTRQLRAGDHAAALAHAEAGLALWDGTPRDTVVTDDPVEALRAERVAAHRSLVRTRALALARLGRHGEAVEPLTALAADLPRDEEVLLELLRGEAATVGASAALARYEAYRRALRDELGTDPGAALQAAYQHLLRGDTPVVRQGVAAEPNPLLGRDEDLAAVAALVRRSRVTSIVGPGGLGKTRLANAVARDAEQRVVQVVPLAGVATDADVVRQVASTFDAAEPRLSHPAVPPDPVAGIAAALGSGPALLVLDNCEHVVAGAAELVRALVSALPELRVLTTSRTPLGLSSESVYALPELSLPTMVELFAQRARAARPGVDLPAEAVAELCGHLDGLPLAVELAAARVRVMSVAEIAEHLGDRFALLRGGPRDVPSRHQTLHAVVEWSWNLLDPAGQAAIRALSVFPGGFTAGGARRLLGGEALRTLEDLADQSLLKVVDTGSGARFRMLETVREFGAARRAAAGEDDDVAAGFLAWAREFGLAHHEAALGPDPASTADRIRAEQDNLLQALHQAVARGDSTTVVATTAVLGALWMIESNYARMVALTAEAGWILSHYRPGPDFVEVTRTAATLCTGFTFSSEGPRAVRSLVALRRLPPAPPDTLTRAGAIVLAAVPELMAGSRRLDELCGSGVPLLAAVANAVATYLWEYQGEPDRALSAAERMLAASLDQPVPWARLLARARIADLYLQSGRGAEALPHLEVAMRILEQVGIRHETLGVRLGIVLANLQLGALDAAERQLALFEPDQPEEVVELSSFLAVRAEILLGRDQTEAGLRTWRRVAGMAREAVERGDVPGLDSWTLEVEAATVIAHVRHGRRELVAPLAAALPERLSALLAALAANRTSLAGFPLGGALLLALATVDLDRGETGSGVRLTALAERFHYIRGFRPAMSPEQARQAAEEADKAAYAEAVSAYAALGPDEMLVAARAALRERPQA
ncbi:BTAD domain-containing putative transcriptional regulator [Phytohabitans sp. ZYX-F-186]|uniref:BTAD domain-containing putative transcriptional regulator n=1 Tax=Phytohabitans maris TaxID=3071409 RepID=A0ABU0ZWT7_9ACTN|nr:BTAD domain-containing putative transcriptional regulator [Phytohabitans sp. ZYX-F-186]MDQ7904381.1 BTAD domain-containing putative transcriptional regulator [Phytohabitans sp. ZYX-F-186]MDQ7911408.1 BTAD domain-containing putative transcriptional regulator [Phytohabitans sp. ZYX-F-186]